MAINRCPLADDERAVTEVMGTFLAVTLTIILVSAVAAGILGMMDSDASASTTAQGEIYTISKKIILSNTGGDAIPTTHLKVLIFVNGTNMYEPNFKLITQGYTMDDDGVWGIGDRLMLEQEFYADSKVEAIIIDKRSNNIISNVDLVVREGQSPPTTGSATTTTTIITTTTTTIATTTTTIATTTIVGCLDMKIDSIESIGSSHEDVGVNLFSHPASQVDSISVLWEPSGGDDACTLGYIIINLPGSGQGLGSEIKFTDLSCGCGFCTGEPDKHSTIPSNHDVYVEMNNFEDSDGSPVDMRGATIAISLEYTCLGNPYVLTLWIEVPES